MVFFKKRKFSVRVKDNFPSSSSQIGHLIFKIVCDGAREGEMGALLPFIYIYSIFFFVFDHIFEVSLIRDFLKLHIHVYSSPLIRTGDTEGEIFRHLLHS
jgi:hypothetical protein